MEDRLKYILTTVNEWLRFAETKNGALFAANGVIAVGIANVLAIAPQINVYIRLYLLALIVFLMFSAACCILSFVPQIKIPWFVPTSKNAGAFDSLVFYGDIAKYECEDYLKALHKRYGNGEIEPPITSIERDYAQQIIINSRIAMWKYQWFRVAVWFTLSVIVTPIPSLMFILKRRHV